MKRRRSWPFNRSPKPTTLSSGPEFAMPTSLPASPAAGGYARARPVASARYSPRVELSSYLREAAHSILCCWVNVRANACASLSLNVPFAPLQAGKAVKLLSSIPVVGVLAGPVGTALEVGDGYVQTRRLEKVGLLPRVRHLVVATCVVAEPCVPRL